MLLPSFYNDFALNHKYLGINTILFVMNNILEIMTSFGISKFIKENIINYQNLNL